LITIAICVLLVVIGIIITYCYSIFYDVPYVPTPKPIARQMLKMSELKPGELLYDLGSGDGRVLIMAAREFGAKCVGIELNSFRCKLSNWRIKRMGLSNQIKVVRSSFFEADLSKADIVFMYLLPSINEKLKPKLINELKNGARVVTFTFIIKGWNAHKFDDELKIYLYKI